MRTRDSKRTLKWNVLAQSVRGADHCRRDTPNQDAVEWFPVSGQGPPLVVAVSDGHGSPKSFRSERGARFAVSVAVAEARRLLLDVPDSVVRARRTAESELAPAIVSAWEARALQDLAEEPFTTSERRRFTAKYGATAWKSLRQTPLLAYGATLLMAVATPAFLLLAQIGDGDIVEVSPAGCATRALEADPRLFAGETTSLCLPDAVASFCISVRPMREVRPALVLLSTDGYANSYEDDAGFLSVGSDLLTMLREEGVEAVQRDLAPWLEEVSRDGSGDDITLGVLCIL